MGPPQYPISSGPTQERRHRYRQRRCLLKGCERAFEPVQPGQHFCGAACQKEAARWRRWQNRHKYRSSENGKQRRRQQSRRYRQRCRERRAAAWEEMLQAIEVQVSQEAAAAQLEAEVAQLESAKPREGGRPASPTTDFCQKPCRRPGCYVLFTLRPSAPHQCFCCSLCRQALRRVVDREAHWHARRRQRQRQRDGGRRSRSPPR